MAIFFYIPASERLYTLGDLFSPNLIEHNEQRRTAKLSCPLRCALRDKCCWGFVGSDTDASDVQTYLKDGILNNQIQYAFNYKTNEEFGCTTDQLRTLVHTARSITEDQR